MPYEANAPCHPQTSNKPPEQPVSYFTHRARSRAHTHRHHDGVSRMPTLQYGPRRLSQSAGPRSRTAQDLRLVLLKDGRAGLQPSPV